MGVGISPLPPITVQVAFGSTPLNTSPTWTNISSLCKAIKIRRGRQHELNHFEPGTCELTLLNTDRSLDPDNASSTYNQSGNAVDINKQLQVLVNWNLLPAVEGGATMSSGWTAGASTSVSYSSGNLVLTRNTSTGNATASTPTGTNGFAVVPGQLYSGMASFKGTSVRACNVAITFYNAAGASLTTTTGADTNDSTSAFVQATVGATADATAAFGAITVTGKAMLATETVTIQQAGVMPASGVTTWEAGGPVPLFTGFIDTISQLYRNNLYTGTSIVASDGLRLLRQEYVAQGIYQYTVVTTDGATNFWRFNDSSGLSAADVGASSHAGTYGLNGVTLGQYPTNGFDSANTILMDSGQGYVDVTSSGGAPGASGASSSFSVECWFQWSGTTAVTFYQQGTVASPAQLTLGLNASGYATFTYGTKTGTGITQHNDGRWHHYCFIFNSSNSHCDHYVDAVAEPGTTAAPSAISATLCQWGSGETALNGGGVAAASGSTIGLANGAFYNAILTGTQVTNHYNLFAQGFVDAEDSGARTKAVLNSISWPSTWMNIGTGDTAVQKPAASLALTSSLSYIQQLESTEHGYFFANASGVLTYIHRQAYLKTPYTTSQGTFGDQAGQVAYKPLPEWSRDNLDLFNQSQVTRLGGITKTANNTTSQTAYGVTSLLNESGLLSTNDNDSLARAQWNVAHYGTPLTRVRSIVIDPGGDPATRYNQLIFRELMDQITVVRNPYKLNTGFGNPQFSQQCTIEGMEHNIVKGDNSGGVGVWETTYHLSPFDTQQYLVLDDTTLGKLDSNRLAY